MFRHIWRQHQQHRHDEDWLRGHEHAAPPCQAGDQLSNFPPKMSHFHTFPLEISTFNNSLFAKHYNCLQSYTFCLQCLQCQFQNVWYRKLVKNFVVKTIICLGNNICLPKNICLQNNFSLPNNICLPNNFSLPNNICLQNNIYLQNNFALPNIIWL